MPTLLSVNLNKIATLRNTRDVGYPDLLHFGRIALAAGAHGLTIHPRPDERHIRAADVAPLAELCRDAGIEFNIEGNPFEGRFMQHCRDVQPTQATLVPDTLEQSTSDHGWDFTADVARLKPVVAELREFGCRVSLFADHDADMDAAAATGAERVELYTEPYAADGATLPQFVAAAERARAARLGVNAGHDLNLDNLPAFAAAVPDLLEVSIGHALIADALEHGMTDTVKRYLRCLEAEG
ncbi:MAG: pyridoxine 5'-phosphate synthase [Planctomycetota bacterium]